MNHELANELKDAGYPGSIIFCDTCPTQHILEAPTLSELIEACGDFEILGRSSEEWFSEGMQTPRVYGSTPEEAVARLYLALNKK